jgi:hypothetical protein
MQWSLRTLLIATAIVPVAIFAIAKSTPLYVSAAVTVAAVAWIVVAIIAWIDTGSRQAWARGMILAATAYGLLVVSMGTELELQGSRLATSGVLYYAHNLTASDDIQPQLLTFTLMSADGSPGGSASVGSFADVPISANTDSGFSGTAQLFRNLLINSNQSPTRRDFGVIGHIYWGMLLGLAGGWFAVWIERRKASHEAKQAASIKSE